MVVVSLGRLGQWSPFEHDVWHEEIEQAITKGDLQGWIYFGDPLFSKLAGRKPKIPIDRVYHIRRVAYLVVHGWQDPIELDVGVPSLGCNVSWIVQDGNHRLAAAFYRKDPTIRCGISGSVEYAAHLLGVPVEEI